MPPFTYLGKTHFRFIYLIWNAFRKRLRQASSVSQATSLELLAEDLRAGGPGSVGVMGRVEGKVEVQIRGNTSGAVGVCLCRSLNVMYWWRAVGKNGHSLFLSGVNEASDNNSVTGNDILAHGAVAAVRLWGAMWEKADRVEIFLPEIENEKVKRKLLDQVEDCQNKYGVRVVVAFEGRGGGAQDLAEQLLSGRGAGQVDEGWHNMNLRMVDNVVHQLVDHTDKLARHYFDL